MFSKPEVKIDGLAVIIFARSGPEMPKLLKYSSFSFNVLSGSDDSSLGLCVTILDIWGSVKPYEFKSGSTEFVAFNFRGFETLLEKNPVLIISGDGVVEYLVIKVD